MTNVTNMDKYKQSSKDSLYFFQSLLLLEEIKLEVVNNDCTSEETIKKETKISPVISFFRKFRRKEAPSKKCLVEDADPMVQFYINSELEDLETPPRSRPDSLESLCKNTKFSQQEIKRIYRGFKAECPTGVVKEDTFKVIYSQFFPQGANTSHYAHYVFNTLDHDKSGIINFENFLQCLSVLSRGTMDEKMRWIFSLYDINGDGCITREEMTDIVSAIYDLMGKMSNPSVDDFTIKERVEMIFTKMDKNQDGVVTFDEFLDCCRRDECISSSINVFDSSIV
ncbi:Kv channel-interacting protein 1 isoform X2 [Agrilus planipennis]|uniref:Kv channel-interacting protein 1 isoform X2 n=1 Tax=Agrilus planipennis TaxID=224129 RepID=A0A7F5QUY2_AGRPL|nr:Kv channel-interacting protein 1 isoform X2 [Agrilus planipennis]XP_025828856.1 Kv channel-interacting protein 1 isoform X2 [Agrilus planipennis]